MALTAGLLIWTGQLLSLAAPYGLSSREPVGPFLNNQMPELRPALGNEQYFVVDAFPNLTFEDPTFFLVAPRTNRCYVGTRQGAIYSFPNDPATANKTLFLDLRPRTQGYEDCGLLGMAFHPEWRQPGSTNRGFIYVHYQYTTNRVLPPPGQDRPDAYTPCWIRLSRFTVPDGSLTADPASELVLIQQFDRHLWHNGGALFFGLDGFLYLTIGDEGGIDDEFGQSQRLDGGLFSGVLRLDVNRDPTKSHPVRRQPQSPPGSPASFSQHYFIPNDNPWQDPNGNILEEFWAIGLRSPHRMTLDPPTGRIWLGDVGQGTREEINIIEKSGNYQWAYLEGSFDGPFPKPAPLIGNDKPPLFEYDHDTLDTCVIGGYVYRGSRFPELVGKYIFGDNTSGRVFALTDNGSGNPPSVAYLCNIPPGTDYTGLSSFGIDHDNELYLCQMGPEGKVYKLASEGVVGPPAPGLLSETGAFTDTTNLVPAAALIPYDVNSPLWSDAAIKTRWMAVPNNGAPYSASEQIGFAPAGEWTFPSGTVFVKHFELATNELNLTQRRRLETRFIVRDTNGSVYGLTYKWRPDQKDAELLRDSLSEEIVIRTASGMRTQTWFYPSPQDCLRCHTPAANYVLGVKTRQLNGDFTYPSAITDNQLRTLNSLGLFNPALVETNISSYAKLVAVTNTSAPIETRVRSYLDANCASCHRPGGVQGAWDARFDTPLEEQNILNGAVRNNLGIPNARVVTPGDVSRSLLYLRMHTNNLSKMPPLARNEVDAEAAAAVAEWIRGFVPGPIPPPWQHQDIGGVGLAGGATHLVGLFNVSGSGTDIWDVQDEFHFLYQPVSGDCEIIAQVVALENTNPWAKAGLMIRENLTRSSPNAFIAVTPENGVEFQWRAADGETSFYLQGPNVLAPRWLRLVRAGDTFTAYESTDGVSWMLVHSMNITMPERVVVGLASSAVNNEALNSASFSSVQLTADALPTLPPPWQRYDVGETAVLGDSSFAGGTFTLSNTGGDIGGSSDAFHFVLQPVTDDCEIIARVLSISGGASSAKAGIMLRETPSAIGSRHVFFGLTRGGGAQFQRRAITNGASFSTSFNGVSAPQWLRLVRQTNTFSAYRSVNGTDWTFLGATNLSLHHALFAGLVVSAGNDNPATAEFTDVQVNRLGAAPDSDGDGMPDDFELAHGFDGGDPADAVLDADGDRLTNLEEYLAGTDPRDATSVLRITGLERANNDLIVRFLAATGRIYALERSTNLPPSWTTLTNTGPASQSTIAITNLDGASAGRVFFRIRLVP